MKILIGPFRQILTLSQLPLKGSLNDDQLEIITDGGVLIENRVIKAVAKFDVLYNQYPEIIIEEIEDNQVLLPGFIDCHTHLCFAGDRAKDHALRIAGRSYQDIAASGGGIWDSVTLTRGIDEISLSQLLLSRVNRHLSEGVTTIEVKSGYGLNTLDELKQLRAIRSIATLSPASLIPTCLAAHVLPKDFSGIAIDYLAHVLNELLPIVQKEGLAERVDIFVEEGAFTIGNGIYYLTEARRMGFEVTVHADQFSTGGSEVAIKLQALSADHLEASTEAEIKLLAKSNTVAVVLPGASLGLGMPYAPARKLLNGGACLAIASDWNPGSAPMGDLLLQASVLAASEKLTTAEVLAGLTLRAAKALKLNDRGALTAGSLADMQSYPINDYREILYYQGKLKPQMVWKGGELIK